MLKFQHDIVLWYFVYKKNQNINSTHSQNSVTGDVVFSVMVQLDPSPLPSNSTQFSVEKEHPE